MPRRLPQSTRERFAEERAMGNTIAAAAAAAGISQRCGRNWDDDPGIVALVDRLRRAREERIAAKVAALIERWLDAGLPTNQLIDLYKATALKGATIRHEHTGEDGGPIRHEHDLSRLSDDELALLETLRVKIDAGLVEA